MTKELTSLSDIEALTKRFAEANNEVTHIVTQLNDEIEKVKRKHMRALKTAVASAALRKTDLQALIEENPGLFTKPRTFVFHGIKIGFTKQKGKITIEDPAKTVALIKKHLPDLAEVLINKVETPSKDSLSTLTGDQLKRIGCGVTNDTDAVVIKPTDTEIEKAVAALLKDAIEDLQQEAA